MATSYWIGLQCTTAKSIALVDLLTQKTSQNRTTMAKEQPIDGMGFLRPSYVQHVESWLAEQGKTWDASLVATKVGNDIEKQQEDEGKRLKVDEVLVCAFAIHQVLSKPRHDDRFWVEMLPHMNPELLALRPSITEMAENPDVGAKSFLAEFDLLVRELSLNDKDESVVIFNLPNCQAWSTRWRHETSAAE
jgi:hypothetical protein